MTTLQEEYTQRFRNFLTPAAKGIEEFLEEVLGQHSGVCSVKTRPKGMESFLEKAGRKNGETPRYSDPLNQIQDQIGALVTTRFLADVAVIESIIQDSFSSIEKKLLQPESNYEFGYIGRHFILFIPTDVWSPLTQDPPIRFFELQIKTLFQYAWSETNHKIGYKQLSRLDIEEKKLTAYIAAQAWGADRAVNELYEKLLKKPEDGEADA
ncbi:GTP pyrophosphokinase [Planctomicrobium sp. SH668]|uniref:GTP pyrophosphokinase n=1 Tax=Planctomicrobium sp. SH668 TaxID=3448126 RepID=UPI003F5BF8D1